MTNSISNYKLLDMFNKRRILLYFCIFILLIFWFIGIQNKGEQFLVFAKTLFDMY